MSIDVKISANQIRAIEWLANSKYDRVPSTQQDLAKELGVRPETICRWKREEWFREAVIQRARELLKDDLSEIYAALRREARQGSFQHIKLAMEMAKEYVPKQEVSGPDGGPVFVLDDRKG